jgi:FeS assembly SUF system protein
MINDKFHSIQLIINHSNKRMENKFLESEEKIVKMLKTVYDPEIPVNIYDLGLIYGVDIDDEKNVTITMTLTAPGCPAADFITEDVKMRVQSIPEIRDVAVKIVFEPEWHQGLMSEEAKLELGFL